MDAVNEKARAEELSSSVTAFQHDVREPLPFGDASFDGCFSHMLFCMALKTVELEALSREVCRVLRSGGLHIYTVRNTEDVHYETGIHHGEDMYEHGGFIVHFFSEEKVRALSEGFEIVGIDRWMLFRATLRKRCS